MSSLISNKKQLATLRQFGKDVRWYTQKYNYLRKKRGDKFVAIRMGRVLDSDKNPDELLIRLRQKYHNINSVVVKYVSTRDVYPAR